MGIAQFNEYETALSIVIYDDVSGLGPYNEFGNPNGMARLDSAVYFNSDTVDHVMTFAVAPITPGTPFGQVTIPARRGFDGTEGIDVMSVLFPPTFGGLVMAAGVSWVDAIDVAPTTGSAVVGVLSGGKVF